MTITPDSTTKSAPLKPTYKQLVWIGVAAVALILILWVNARTAWYEQSAKASEALTPPKILGPEKDVVALAWLDQGSLKEGGRGRLWVLFENRSDADVRGLRFLTLQTPGFRKVGFCWVAGGPACIPAEQDHHLRKGLPRVLKKGQTVSVYAFLEEAGIGGKPLAASGVFTWRDLQGERENAFMVPAVPVVSRFEWLWFGLGKSVLFLKDLLVPAALAYLGWYLQHRDRQRDAQAEEEKLDREKQERKQERQRAEREKEQARVRETWNLMLPRSHTNAEQHYMPVAAAITALLRTARTIRQDSAEEEWQRLLWEQLRFLCLMRRLAHSIGGFYFRSREGEDLASECWDKFLRQTRDHLRLESLERAVAALDPHENFAAFKDKLVGCTVEASSQEVAKALAQLDTNLRRWAGLERGFQRNLPLVELLGVILSYEMNRPYEIWYGAPARFEREAFWIALERLEPELVALQKRLAAYLETVGNT
jgi:hypothetical protein